VINRWFWIALALPWGLVGLVNPRIQALELQPAKMKRLLITMSAVAALGLPALAQAAVSNTAWLQGTSLDGGSTDLRGTNPKLIS
jgi:hypothetical protein